MSYNRNLILIFHILIVGPIFLYLGLMKSNSIKMVKHIVVGIGVILALYHSFLTYKHYNTSKYLSYLNLTHILFFAPLLIYTGSVENAVYPTYDILCVLGSGIIILSIYKLIK